MLQSWEPVVGGVSAVGSLAAAVAAWWAARVALKIAREANREQSVRESRVEAMSVLSRRVEELLRMLSAAEVAAIDHEPWVVGEGVHTEKRFRTVDGPASRRASAASSEFRARLVATPEYLPLTRALVLEGIPFDAGAAGAPFDELEQLLGDDERWWQGLELDDATPIGLQVVRAEILATVRALERLQREFALTSAAQVCVLDGWQMSLRVPHEDADKN